MILKANQEIGEKLWLLLGEESVVDKFTEAKNMWAGVACIEDIRSIEFQPQRMLLPAIDALIASLNHTQDMADMPKFIYLIQSICQDLQIQQTTKLPSIGRIARVNLTDT